MTMTALSAPPDAAIDPMPVTPLGMSGRYFRFRCAAGNEQTLPPEQLLDRDALIALFGGEAWLRRNFPGGHIVVAQRAGGGRHVAVGIDVRAAAFDLAYRCAEEEERRKPKRLCGRLLGLLRWGR